MTRKRFYRPQLDIVRFLAFLLVFVHHSLNRDVAGRPTVHSAIANSLGFGLCLFFTLSAYLITTLLLREREETGTIALSKFYQRRILRIWPLYLLILFIAILWDFHLGILHLQWRWFVACLFMAGNLWQWPGNIASHIWSISVEEQFYVFWPALARSLSRRRLYIAAALMVGLANATLIRFGLIHAETDVRIWGNSFVQFEMFAAGILLALHTSESETGITSVAGRTLALLSLPIGWFISAYFLDIKSTAGTPVSSINLCFGYAIVATTCALFIYAMLGLRRCPKWMVHLGQISYGLYVFHLIPFTFVSHIPGLQHRYFQSIIAFLITWCMAELSYHFFETPFLKLKARLEIVHSRPVQTDRPDTSQRLIYSGPRASSR